MAIKSPLIVDMQLFVQMPLSIEFASIRPGGTVCTKY